jgi:type I restriction enzyme S subunit
MKQLVSVTEAVDIKHSRVKPFIGERRYLATGDLSGTEIGSLYPVDYRTKPSRADLLVREGDILLARMQTTNKVLVIDKSTKDLIVSTGFLTLVPRVGFDANYLAHYFRSNIFQRQKDRYCAGATQKAINNGAFKKLQIPQYSLQEQKKIAKILNQADALRQNRKQSIRLLNTFLQSTFLDMFGDPMHNPRRWDLLELSDVCKEIYRYPTFYGFKYVVEGIPVVKIGNILANGIVNPDLSKYSFITNEINCRYPRTILEMSDILMAVRGDGSTVKRIGLVNHKNLVGANISPNLLRFSADKKVVSPFYLYALVTSESGQKMLEKYVTQTAKKTITAKDIKRIKIPVPALLEQNRFAEIFKSVQQTKEMMGRSRDAIENQVNSLAQRFFGEGNV